MYHTASKVYVPYTWTVLYLKIKIILVHNIFKVCFEPEDTWPIQKCVVRLIKIEFSCVSTDINFGYRVTESHDGMTQVKKYNGLNI